MPKVFFQNVTQVYKFNRQHGLSNEENTITEGEFLDFRRRVESRQQGFLNLGKQQDLVEKITHFAADAKNKFKHFVILGIGGSMLGPKTIVEALAYQTVKNQVIFVDNIDPFLIKSVLAKIDLSQTLFLVQTKSGQTPETIAQYSYFKHQLRYLGLEWTKHFVFVTDPTKGWLRQIAVQENILSFDIPENVGGRFSVLTPVGLLITALVGLDVPQMLAGAESIVQQEFWHSQSVQAFKLAKTSFLLSQKGKNNLVIMPYSSRLKTFTDWCIQLIAESTGKQFDLKNNEVNAGLTPIPAMGATDQHSQLQLFKEGPNDKHFIFIEVQDYGVKVDIPTEELTDNKALGYLSGQSFDTLIQAEFEGTRQSLTESLRPNITISVSKVDEFNLGALFMFFQLYTVFLGEMLNINTFDQPGVERSKILTQEILNQTTSFQSHNKMA